MGQLILLNLTANGMKMETENRYQRNRNCDLHAGASLYLCLVLKKQSILPFCSNEQYTDYESVRACVEINIPGRSKDHGKEK